jgi:hypothetical protein
MVWKQIVASTAGSRVMWVYTGALVVMKEGKYIICDTYRDGSKVWIEGKLEIDASVSQPQNSEVFHALSLILLPPSSAHVFCLPHHLLSSIQIFLTITLSPPAPFMHILLLSFLVYSFFPREVS